SIMDDILLVSVYTTGNVTLRGMLIQDAFLTKEIRATNDYKEYEMAFVGVVVPMNRPKLVMSTQGMHKTTPRAHRTPTLIAANSQGRKGSKDDYDVNVIEKKDNEKKFDNDETVDDAEEKDDDDQTDHALVEPQAKTAQLVPKFQSFGRCNNYDVLQNIRCPPECKIVGHILLDQPLRYALTATADVPAVYLQQF
nr:hypothetical protein [Tanacetum cinerariifolium]